MGGEMVDRVKKKQVMRAEREAGGQMKMQHSKNWLCGVVSAVLLVSVTLLVPSTANAQEDISTSMCSSYLQVVEQAINLRQQSVPINIAREMADSAFSLNPQLYRFITSAINTAYKNPQAVTQALNDGTLLSMCAKEVRGF